jgi:hypothetical protein
MSKYEITVDLTGYPLSGITIDPTIKLYSTLKGITTVIYPKVTSIKSLDIKPTLMMEEKKEGDGLEVLEKRLNKIAKENFDDPVWRKDIASAITEAIFLGVHHESNLPFIVTVQNAPFNERVLIKETKGGKIAFVSQGGFVESHMLSTNVIEVPRATLAFHIVEMEDKLRTNFADIQANLTHMGIEGVDASVYQMLYSTICAAVVNEHRYVDIDPIPSLDSAISEVRDAAQDFGCVILGRERMVGVIKNNKNFLPETDVDLVKRGLVGSYWGAKVIVLRNHANDAGSFFPANEFVVIGHDAATWVWFGAPISQEWLDPEVAEWHYLVRRSFGFIIPRPNRIRRIICSSLPAEPNDNQHD